MNFYLSTRYDLSTFFWALNLYRLLLIIILSARQEFATCFSNTPDCYFEAFVELHARCKSYSVPSLQIYVIFAQGEQFKENEYIK